MSRRVTPSRVQVKVVKHRSRSESESEEGVEWDGVDPKPRELPMARVKVR